MTSIKEMWERLQERLAENKQIRQSIDELSKLSDNELHDLGLHRSMINSVAKGKYHA